MSKEKLKEISDMLVGKKVVGVRFMNKKEAKSLGWYKLPLIIFFDDGSYIYASSDEEGNNGGAYFTSSDEIPVIGTLWI